MYRSLFVVLSIFLIFPSCDKEGSETCENIILSTSINKIMPLGASRVEGARPAFESYRYELWKQLLDGGWTFDLIGTMCDESSYPEYNGQGFDVHHEGRGGYTSGQILDSIDEWLDRAGTPDIVLFSSPGGNDALEGLSYSTAIDNINAIIDALQATNPNVIIIIEQMAPALTEAMTPELMSYFEQMQQDVVSIASEQTTPTSQILTVDMYTGFNDAFLADDVHYNEAGADFIADRYYAVLEAVLEE